MKRLLLLFVFACGIGLYAQDEIEKEDTLGDFIIKTTGDTVFGKLKFLSGDGDIKTKISCKVNDTLKVSLKASEVKYFRSGKDEYIVFQPEGETGHFFLKIWELGPYIELYEWQLPIDFSGGNKIEYFPIIRKKGDDKFIELDPVHWNKHLVEFIEDYEELAEDVWRNRYKTDQLGEVIRKYNEWKEDNK